MDLFTVQTFAINTLIGCCVLLVGLMFSLVGVYTYRVIEERDHDA